MNDQYHLLHEAVGEYASHSAARFHMPGHKGRAEHIRAGMDVTELPGTDDLLDPGGPALRSMELASRLFGAGYSLISCGGATLCVQAAVCALKKLSGWGTMLLCGRSSHRSIVNALILCGLDVGWLTGDGVEMRGQIDGYVQKYGAENIAGVDFSVNGTCLQTEIPGTGL